MASPQESITTVNGRRCTRSRARTAATSTSISTPAAPPTKVASTEPTTSTVAEQAPQTQPTAANPPASQPPPPPPPSPPAPSVSSSQPEQSAVVVPVPTSQAAVSSALAIGPSSSSPPTTPPAAQPVVTETAGVADPTSVTAVPDVLQTISSSQTPLLATSVAELLPQTSSAAIISPTRGPGTVAPEQGTHIGGDGHTGEGHSSHSGSDPNLGGIVGGIVGGFVVLALLSALLFFCLRRRKSKEAGWNEKSEDSSDFLSKAKAVPAGFGMFFAKLRNEKTGPSDNPYQRHQPRSSVGSVYSTTSSGRGRSISEPQGQFAAGGGFMRRMSSRKSERNVLRKKTSSVSSQSPFMDISEEPIRNNNIGSDPFADPGPDTPRNLRISNPDTLEEETRGPSPPQPAATPLTARDPFASLIDQIDGAPNWLRDSNMTASSASNHRRTQSTASALKLHPPSSVYSSNPFADPSPIPPIPTQQPQQPLSTYSAFPAVRESNYTFFGEPGPSRPGTTMFAPGLPSNPSASRPGTNIFSTAAITPGFPSSGLPTSTSRMDRQSDPFDLDRPEVLSFKGIMNQMRDSIARQTTIRSRRTSSVGNWFARDASPSGALNGASVRR
ncbi:hypothetical protein M3J09_006461 [Ascochyta lentis]